MFQVADPSNVSDAASQCLATVLALRGKPVSVSRVAHQFNTPANVNSIELVPAARAFGCQAKRLVVAKYDVTQLPTPCIIDARARHARATSYSRRLLAISVWSSNQVTLLPKRASPN